MAKMIATFVFGIGISLIWSLNVDFTHAQIFTRTAITTFLVNQTLIIGMKISDPSDK